MTTLCGRVTGPRWPAFPSSAFVNQTKSWGRKQAGYVSKGWSPAFLKVKGGQTLRAIRPEHNRTCKLQERQNSPNMDCLPEGRA